MKKRIATVLATTAGLWAFLALPAPALAQQVDFTLSATVDLQSLHEDLATYTVDCFVCAAGQCPTTGDNLIGHALQNFDTNGAFNVNQQVQVLVNAEEGKDPRDAVAYYCQIKMKDPANTNTFLPSENSNFPFALAEEGSQPVTVLEGAISQ